MTLIGIILSIFVFIVFHTLLYLFLDALNNIFRSHDFIRELKYISTMKGGVMTCSKKAFRQLCDRYEITEFPAFRTPYIHYIPDVNSKYFSCTIKRKDRKLVHSCLLFMQIITIPLVFTPIYNTVLVASVSVWVALSCLLLVFTGILSVEKELAIYNVVTPTKFTNP